MPPSTITRPRGRPPVADADRREYVCATRLTRAEADRLADHALANDITEGDVLRAALAVYLRGRR